MKTERINLNKLQLNLEHVGMICESQGIYSIEGQLNKHTLYVTGDGIIDIIQTDGRLRIPLGIIPAFIEELQSIADDYKSRILDEREIKPMPSTGKGRRRIEIDEDAMIFDILQGKKNDEISKKFKVSKSYVYNKKKEYREMGLI